MDPYNLVVCSGCVLAAIVSCFFAARLGKRHHFEKGGPSMVCFCGISMIASMTLAGFAVSAAIDNLGMFGGLMTAAAQLPIFGFAWLLITSGDIFLKVLILGAKG